MNEPFSVDTQYQPDELYIKCGNVVIMNDTGNGYATKFYVDGILQKNVYEVNVKININSVVKLEVKSVCLGDKK